MRIAILFVYFFLFSTIVIGQGHYSTTNKKAIKSYEEALQYFDRYDYEKAAELMNKAIQSDKNFIEAYIVLAEVYIESGNRNQAIQSYLNAIRIDPEFFPAMYFTLAQLEMKESKFEDAMKHLEKFLSYNNLKPIIRSQAKHQLESCKFAINAMKNPVPFNPTNLGDSINSEFDEYWPSLTADEQTLTITRLIPRVLEDNVITQAERKTNIQLQQQLQEDFYISTKETDFWQAAKNVGEPLNTKGNEGAQTISVDGRLMYFTACNRPEGKGRCDIYLTTKTREGWSEPTNLGAPVNSSAWEAQPSISPDGKTLYFVSNREGGKGQKDLWYSTLKNDNKWSEPVNLGEKVNTKGDEQSPFIHPDNNTLYFASDGRIGMGGFDLFKVTKNDDGTWGEPVNLGYPINTVHDEIGLIVNAKGDKAMYSSDRLSHKGRDIFEFELYQEARPKSVSYLKGTVTDAENNKKLKAVFELINIDTKETVMQAESDDQTGEFLVCIPTESDYALNVSKPGYLFYSDNFSLKGVYEISDPYMKDIELKPIKIGEKIILKNIFYATDSYKLDTKSVVELTKLLDLLKNNPALRIEISGHTDNIGADDYNLELSRNRANSVYSYLIDSGINKNRLEYKGYGESEPISSNETERGRAENRRTEIKIIGK